jgi:hypothetical protein
MFRSVVLLVCASIPFYAPASSGDRLENTLEALNKQAQPVEAPEMTGALEAAGCKVAGSFDLGEGSSGGEEQVLWVKSMGTIVLAKCGSDTAVALTRAVRVERVVNGKVKSVISNELNPRSRNLVGNGPVMRRGRTETGSDTYVTAWRDESGQQYILRAFDQPNQEHAERTLMPLQQVLRRSIE